MPASRTYLGEYTGGLDEILALHPKRYTYKGNDTRADEQPKNLPQLDEDGVVSKEKDTRSVTVPYGNSPHYQAATEGREFIGLIAQDAEPVMPEMVKQGPGTIDGQAVSDLRVLDPNALVYALINAVKDIGGAGRGARGAATGTTLMELLLLHTLDGRAVYVSPLHIVSVGEARIEGKLSRDVNCVVNLVDGKFITVIESCTQIKDRLGK